jgi:hypothetical protein
LEGFGCVVRAISIDLVHLALLAFGCCAEGARFADRERSGVNIGRKIEPVGNRSDYSPCLVRLARIRGDVLRIVLFYGSVFVRHDGYWL